MVLSLKMFGIKQKKEDQDALQLAFQQVHNKRAVECRVNNQVNILACLLLTSKTNALHVVTVVNFVLDHSIKVLVLYCTDQVQKWEMNSNHKTL